MEISDETFQRVKYMMMLMMMIREISNLYRDFVQRKKIEDDKEESKKERERK